MNKFSDFNIQPKISSFTGDKIKMHKVLNTPIRVLDFKIEPSKAISGTEYMTLQIEKQSNKHIIFTSSKVLMSQIKDVPKDKFPFETTIVGENESYQFT